MSSTNILSRPTGPRELLTMLAIDDAAMTVMKRRSHLLNVHLKIAETCLNVHNSSYNNAGGALQCSVILFSVGQIELATPSDHDSVCSLPLA